MVDFVATGGYALKTYERFARIKQDKQGRWRVANPRVRQSYRLNVGTIVEEAMLKVRLVRSRGGGAGATGMIGRGGRMLGEIEEYFIEGLVAGDTFVFGGEIVRYEALVEDQVYVSRANDRDAKVPSYMGGKFPLSTYLAERVRKLLDDRRQWNALPEQVRDWLSLQRGFSRVPAVRELLVETFPRGGKHYFVCYPFEGRLAHQTLGMLLTRRLERARARPLGFVANEYALAVWGLGDMSFMIRHGKLDLAALFAPDMLGDDLEAWLAESALMKRTFRNCALISGLIPRRFTGEEKSRRQVLFSTDLVYDVLRKHQADHVLLRAARADAATGLLDLKRLGDMLSRIQGRITHRELDHVSPLAVPVMLEIGREVGLWRSVRRVAGGSRRRTRQRGDGIERDASAISWRDDRTLRASVFDDRRRTLLADLSGALFWQEQRLLVVSDLHLEKGSSFAARGVLLPPYDTVATLSRLAAVIARHDPRMVIALGDSFHDRTAHERLSGDRPRRALGDAGAARLDLDFGQSRSGAAVRSRRRGRERSRDRPDCVPPRADRRAGRNRRPSASQGARRHPRPLDGTAMFCLRRRARRDAGVRRLHRRPEHPRCGVRENLPQRRPDGPCARRQQAPRHRRVALLLSGVLLLPKAIGRGSGNWNPRHVRLRCRRAAGRLAWQIETAHTGRFVAQRRWPRGAGDAA